MNNPRQIGRGQNASANQKTPLPLRFNPATAGTDELWGYDEELIRIKTCIGQIFVCPNHIEAGFFKVPSQPSYGFNWYYDYQPITKAKSSTILCAEVHGADGTGTHRADRDSVPPGELELYRHRYKVNWLYFDCHVEWLTYADASGPDLINWGEDLG